MAGVRMMCAGVGMVTGMGLAGAFRQKFPRWMVAVIGAADREHDQYRFRAFRHGGRREHAGCRPIWYLRLGFLAWALPMPLAVCRTSNLR